MSFRQSRQERCCWPEKCDQPGGSVSFISVPPWERNVYVFGGITGINELVERADGVLQFTGLASTLQVLRQVVLPRLQFVPEFLSLALGVAYVTLRHAEPLRARGGRWLFRSEFQGSVGETLANQRSKCVSGRPRPQAFLVNPDYDKCHVPSLSSLSSSSIRFPLISRPTLSHPWRSGGLANISRRRRFSSNP